MGRMNDQAQQNGQTTTEARRPDFTVHNERDGRTTEVGAAWRNKTKDGREAISIVVDRRPYEGDLGPRLVLFERQTT